MTDTLGPMRSAALHRAHNPGCLDVTQTHAVWAQGVSKQPLVTGGLRPGPVTGSLLFMRPLRGQSSKLT